MARRPMARVFIIRGLLLCEVSKSLECKPFSPHVITDYCFNGARSGSGTEIQEIARRLSGSSVNRLIAPTRV